MGKMATKLATGVGAAQWEWSLLQSCFCTSVLCMETSLGIALESSSLVGSPLAIRGHIQKQFPPWSDWLADDTWNVRMPPNALRFDPLAAACSWGLAHPDHRQNHCAVFSGCWESQMHVNAFGCGHISMSPELAVRSLSKAVLNSWLPAENAGVCMITV